MSNHYLLYGHGGSYNHGAEAITRSTIALLRRLSPDCRITLSTHFAEQDKEFGLPADEFIERNMSGKTNAEIYAPTIDKITPESICLHVGGDNYCYSNWQRWAMIHYAALDRGAKSILWSCSIDPEMIDGEMLDALKTHHLITARESVTYNALAKFGLNNVKRVSDIAFLLEPENVEFKLGNYVVLNVSPLVVKRNPGILPEYKELLNYIINMTDMNVALVPHVVQPVDNDYDVLKSLGMRYSERIRLVSDKLSAGQYKSIISNARFCVAARTHVAIAAYSTCVPTLAVGYSAKAEGIAADLGMDNYVIASDCIVEGSELLEMFNVLRDNESAVKARLEKQMPQYAAIAAFDSHSGSAILS